jgi:hypothetical protein
MVGGPAHHRISAENAYFIGILLIRGTQLPRLLPRRFATGFLVTKGRKSVALIWRSIRLGLFSCRLLAVVDGAHGSVRKTEVGKVPKSIGIQVGPSEVRVTHYFNQFDFNAGAEL